jgi:hypothetical protein
MSGCVRGVHMFMVEWQMDPIGEYHCFTILNATLIVNFFKKLKLLLHVRGYTSDIH